MTGGFQMKDLRVWKKVGRNLLNTTVAFLMLNHYICKYIDVDEHTNSIKNLIRTEAN